MFTLLFILTSLTFAHIFLHYISCFIFMTFSDVIMTLICIISMIFSYPIITPSSPNLNCILYILFLSILKSLYHDTILHHHGTPQISSPIYLFLYIPLYPLLFLRLVVVVMLKWVRREIELSMLSMPPELLWN